MIGPFEAAHVPAAAALLVARPAHPLLGPLDQDRAEREVAALLATEGCSGAVAVAGDEVVGYLLGTPRSGASWGPNRWVEPAGCAGSFLQDLYAVVAAPWVAEGLVAHYVLVPPALAPVFFEIGFGLQHVHACTVPAAAPPDPRVRRAVRADIGVLALLDTVLDQHLVASPVFSAATVTPYQEAVKDWEGSFDDPAFTVFVAEVDGQVLGSTVACDVSMSSGNSGLIAPPSAALLGFAAVLPAARGVGLGRALGSAVSSWAASEGYPVICTDWRSTNLTAARTWPSLGYAPTFLRLHRLVGH